MGTPTLSVLRNHVEPSDTRERSFAEDRSEFLEGPENRYPAARGILTGVVAGVGLWGVILVMAGIIKL